MTMINLAGYFAVATVAYIGYVGSLFVADLVRDMRQSSVKPERTTTIVRRRVQ